MSSQDFEKQLEVTKKPFLTKKTLTIGTICFLCIGGVSVLAAWGFSGGSDENNNPPNNPSGSRSADDRIQTTPTLYNSLSDLGEDAFSKFKEGKVKLTGDADGEQVKSLTAIVMNDKVTEGLFNKLKQGFNPDLSMDAPGSLNTEEREIFEELKVTDKNTLIKAFKKPPPEVVLSTLTTDEMLTLAFKAIASGKFTVKVAATDEPNMDLMNELVDAVKNKGLTEPLFKKLMNEEDTTADDEPVLVELRKLSHLVGPLKIKEVARSEKFFELYTAFNTKFEAQQTQYETGEPSPEEKSELQEAFQKTVDCAKTLKVATLTIGSEEKDRITKFQGTLTLDALFFDYFDQKLIASIKAYKADSTDVQKWAIAMRKCCPVALGAKYSPSNVDKYSDQPIKDCIIEACTLKSDFETFSTKEFDDQAALENEHTSLETRFNAFTEQCADVSGKVEFALPAKNTARVKSDPQTVCTTAFQTFETALDDHFAAPTPEKAEQLKTLLTDAQTICNEVTVANKPPKIGQTIELFAQEKYTALWNNAIANNPQVANVQIFVTARQQADPTFESGKTAQNLLCAFFLHPFLDSFAEKNAEDTKNNFTKARLFCNAADHLAFGLPTVSQFVVNEITSLLIPILDPTAPAPVDASIDEVFAMINFLTRIGTPHSYSHFSSRKILSNFVNFKRNFTAFTTSRQNFITNPEDHAAGVAFRVEVNKMIPFLPPNEVLVTLSEEEKEVGSFLNLAKTDVETEIQNFLFNKLNPDLEQLILSLSANDDDKLLMKLFSKMQTVCPVPFAKVYPVMSLTLDVNYSHNDLKIFIIQKAFIEDAEFTDAMKHALHNALSVSNGFIYFQTYFQHDFEKSMLTIIDKEPLLKAFFTAEEPARTEFRKYIIDAAAYFSDFKNYTELSFENQELADNSYFSLLKHYKKFKKSYATLQANDGNILFSAPTKKLMTIPSNNSCRVPNDAFVAAFGRFLENLEDPYALNAAFKAFKKALVPCNMVKFDCALPGVEMKLELVYLGDFKVFLTEYYNALINRALEVAEPAKEQLDHIRNLSSSLFIEKTNNLEERLTHYYSKVLKVTSPLDIDFEALTIACHSWKVILAPKDVNPLILKAVIHSQMELIWNCYIDRKNFDECSKEFNESTDYLSTITDFDPFVTRKFLLGKIFEARALSYFSDYADPTKGLPNPKELKNFQLAAKRFSDIYNVNRHPEVNIWMNTLKIFKASVPDVFFSELLKNYWNHPDKDIYLRLEQMLSKLIIRHSPEFNTFALENFKKPLLKVKTSDEKTTKMIKFALEALSVFRPWKDQLDIIREFLNVDAFPDQFYLDLLKEDLSTIQNYTAYLNIVPPRYPLALPSGIHQLDFALSNLPNFDDFHAEFEQRKQKFDRLYDEFINDPTTDKLPPLVKLFKRAKDILSAHRDLGHYSNFSEPSFGDLLKRKYFANFDSVKTSNVPVSEDEIKKLQKFLDAAGIAINGRYFTKTARNCLFTYHLDEFKKNFGLLEVTRKKNAVSHWTWVKALSSENPAENVIQYDSLKLYIESELENYFLQIFNNPDLTLNPLIEKTLKTILFLHSVEKSNNFNTFKNIVQLKNYLQDNFKKISADLINKFKKNVEDRIEISHASLMKLRIYLGKMELIFPNSTLVLDQIWGAVVSHLNSLSDNRHTFFYQLFLKYYSSSLQLSPESFNLFMYILRRYPRELDGLKKVAFSNYVINLFKFVSTSSLQAQLFTNDDADSLKVFVENHPSFTVVHGPLVSQFSTNGKPEQMTPAFYIQLMCSDQPALQTYLDYFNKGGVKPVSTIKNNHLVAALP